MDTGPSAIGRYQVRARLGQGGMGVLYLALDPAIDRLIAVKLLRVVDDELRERFLREARLAARLQHPNIVTIYDVGSHDGQPFIAMEYIAGETLAELIQRKAPLALLRKLELALDACQGLAYAHKNGIVHRDIKPANLMVSRDAGVLKVLDFGIARGADSNLTQVGMLMGTPNYMAPEQIEGKPIDQRADIFAVGLVLYELLVYRQAFKAETPHAVLHQVLHQSPKPLRELDAALDTSLVTIVERAIAKDPSKRYSELERLRADLVRVVQRLKTEVDADTVAVPAADVEAARQGGRRELDRQRLAERRAAQIATHLAAAEAALASNDADAALAAAESAALLSPEDPKVVAAMDRAKTAIETREIAAFMVAAQEHMRAGEMTEAGEAVMEALQIDPRHSGAQALRIQIDRAVEERERARERARAVARALAQAEQSLAAGALDAALRATGEALGHDPTSPEAQSARAKVLALVDRQAERAIASAREHFTAERHAQAIHVLEEFSPWHEGVETELSTLKRELEALLQRRREEEEARQRAEAEARVAREAEAAVAAARAHFAADRHADAVRVLEAFAPRERVEHELATLKRDITAAEQRRREEEARIAREAEQAIATARAHFAADRHDDAVGVLEHFSPQERVGAELAALKRDIAAVQQRWREEEEARRKAEEEARITRAAEAALAAARDHFAAGRDAEAVRVLEAFTPRKRVEAELASLKDEIAAEHRRREEEARIAREAQQAIAAARAHFDADRHPEAVRVLETFSPRELVAQELATLKRDIAAVQQRRREEEEARITREAQQAVAAARAHFDADRHADAVRVLEAFTPKERVAQDLAALKRDIAAVEQRRREEEEARITQAARQAVAAAREHFDADRHTEAVRVLEAFTPKERIAQDLAALKRDIAAVQQRRRDEEEARITGLAQQAIAAAREHFAADRHAEAIRVLEAFSPRQRVEKDLVTLKRDIAAVQQRRREEEARIARAADRAIAAAREHFEADRHAEAVRVLEDFSPGERVEKELATLQRDIAAVLQRRRDEEARITREAERAIATAREHFAANRHPEAVRALETFSPRLPHVDAELASLKRDIAAAKQRRREEDEARRKTEEDARIARKAEAAIAEARKHFAADRHAEAVHVLEEFYPRQRVEAELITLKRDIAALQQRRREEEEARKRAEEEARQKREAEEARKHAEAETRRKAEEARQRAEAEARKKAEDARLAREAEETRKRAEAEARRKAEEAARLAAEAEAARQLAEETARRKAAEDARLKAEEETRLAREAAEARQRAEEEARLQAEEAARLAREAEAETARKRADDEARSKREADARRAREAEDARKAADAQAARLREQDAARQKAEEAARLAREAEVEAARKRADDEARSKREADARRARDAEEARKTADAQAARLREQDAARQKAEEAARLAREAEEARRGADERASRLQEAEETRLLAEAEALEQREQEAAREREADEAREREEATGRQAVDDDTQRPGKHDPRKRAGDEWKRKPGGKAAAKAAQKAAAEKAAADKAAADRVARERAAAAASVAASTPPPALAEDEATQRVAVPDAIRRAAATATTAPAAATSGASASTRGARDRKAREGADAASASPSPAALPGAGASSNTMLYGGIGAAALLVIAVVGWFTLGGSNPAPDTQKQGTQVADATLKPADPSGTANSSTSPGSANPGATPGAGASATDSPSNPATPGTGTPGSDAPGTTNPPATETPSKATATATEPSTTPGTTPGDANATDPNAAANAAAAREKAIDDAVLNVRRMIDRGQRQQALDLLGQHLMTYQNAPKLQSQLSDLVNIAQRDADRARTDALRARAAERAVPELQRAENTLRESGQLRQRNRPTDAARGYWRAQDQFAEAGRLAATRPATLPTAPVTTQANNTPPPSTQQPPTQQNPPVTPRVDPPPAQVKPEPPPVRPESTPQTRPEPPQQPAQTADNRAAIQQALNRYAAAHASLSAAQVASVWRTMDAQRVRSLDESFRQQNSHTVSLSGCSIKENGDRATAQCMLRRQIAFKNGQPFDRTNAATFDLEKRGNDWIISGVTVRN